MSRAKERCNKHRVTKITVIVSASVIIIALMSYYTFGQKLDSFSPSIRMVSIFFRHGEKNPTSFYPKDPYAKRLWPGGLGALTMKGSLQAYNLGVHLRKRYGNLLPKNGVYSREDMYVISSYAERCLMSAESLLAGLMPATEKSTKLPIPWQPVPVNSIPRSQDDLIAQKKSCEKYDAMYKKMFSEPPSDLAELNTKSSDLYDALSVYTGKNISTVLDVEFLYNTLKCEDEAGLQLPAWAEDVYPHRILPLAERSYQLFTDNEFMKLVKGGAILREVHKNMVSKVNNTVKSNRKIFLYSGHDITLVNVMNSLGILDQTAALPDYASALVFELHENHMLPGQHEVRLVYYKNSNEETPISVKIPNCSQPCSLKNFQDSIAHLIFSNYDEVCETPKAC